jgi:leucyl-tRNA synthetase
VYYKNHQPSALAEDELPLTLPRVDKYLPTETGEPPLARASKEDWPIFHGDAMDHNTMPGWAGSSWYFLRYMDPHNSSEMVAMDKADYWGAVDLYMGGAEHATGHLLYARFWTKFLHDRGVIRFNEPFRKMVNQGMILGRSSMVYRLELSAYRVPGIDDHESLPTTRQFPELFVTKEIYDEYQKHGRLRVHEPDVTQKLSTMLHELLEENHGMNISNVEWEYGFTALHTDVNLVENDELNIEAFKNWRREYRDAVFVLNEDQNYLCGHEVEKMSKRWYNVVTPDELCDQYGADTLRMYEMFLGPVEQSKPWDTQGISGVHNFLKKFWRLFHDEEGNFAVSESDPTRKELQILHKTIKKVSDDLERLSWNTVVSAMMIAVNDLGAQNCNKKGVLSDLLVLISPYAPHFAEELWHKLGNDTSITKAEWPEFKEEYLKESAFEYPVSFNGKMRFKMELATDLSKEEVEKAVLENPKSDKYLDGKSPKKVIVVPKRIVNIVV